MEQVMVSESDHSEGDEPMNTDEEPAPVPRDIVKKPEEPSKTSSLPKSKEVPKPAATSKAAKGKSAAAGTSKQASIMSFFKKKWGLPVHAVTNHHLTDYIQRISQTNQNHESYNS